MRMDDEVFMSVAIEEARCALLRDEIPVGAAVVIDDMVIARAGNDRSRPFVHAEMSAMLDACRATGTSRLDGCTLYSTLEPCVMCTGALLEMRVSRVVFGAFDPKAGACGSIYDIVSDSRLPFKAQVRRGVKSNECAELLRSFFAARRAAKNG